MRHLADKHASLATPLLLPPRPRQLASAEWSSRNVRFPGTVPVAGHRRQCAVSGACRLACWCRSGPRWVGGRHRSRHASPPKEAEVGGWWHLRPCRPTPAWWPRGTAARSPTHRVHVTTQTGVVRHPSPLLLYAVPAASICVHLGGGTIGIDAGFFSHRQVGARACCLTGSREAVQMLVPPFVVMRLGYGWGTKPDRSRRRRAGRPLLSQRHSPGRHPAAGPTQAAH